MVGYTVNWHPQVNGLLQNQSGQHLKAFLQQEKQARKVIFPSTVKTLLSSNTPCFAQCSRLPLLFGVSPRSDCNSV
jgi:uracil DNA glycosylase